MARPPSLLFDTLIPAIDQGGYDIWDLLDDDQKKSAKGDFWNFNRYISNVKSNDRELQEHFVLTTNEFYNKNWNDIQKHPKLVWQTICLCSHESKRTYYHEWIPLKRQKNKKEEFLAELFPSMKWQDIETMAKITDDKEIKKYCESLGWDKKQINAIKF